MRKRFSLTCRGFSAISRILIVVAVAPVIISALLKSKLLLDYIITTVLIFVSSPLWTFTALGVIGLVLLGVFFEGRDLEQGD